jgi:DNA-binding winged helix-turn-helix (wHTH) protein
MTRQGETVLRVGDWCVRPGSGSISRGGETVRLEARTMRLLVCLAERPGEIVSIDELLDRVWAGVTVAPDSVYQAVASLRRTLGDDSKQPAYIATVPRLGYQLVAAVGPWADATATSESTPEAPPEFPPLTWGRRISLGASLAAALAAAVVLVVWIAGGSQRNSEAAAPAADPQTSIAVLPFLDLTDEMKHEIFVDGMTEELVDKLSRIPGVRVPPARTSLSFKGKDASIREVAATPGDDVRARRERPAVGHGLARRGPARSSGHRLRGLVRNLRPFVRRSRGDRG